MELLHDINIDFMKYRKFWIVVSLVLVLLGFTALFVHGELNIGIDFAGGTQITLQFREHPDVNQLRRVLEGSGLQEVTIQRIGKESENQVMVRTRLIKGQDEGSLPRVSAALDRALNPGQTGGKPDLNRIGSEAIAELLQSNGVSVDAKKISQAIFEKRRVTGLFHSWDDLAGVGGLSPAALESLKQRAVLGNFTVLGTENVGPQIGEELRKRGFYAVLLSLLGMLAYIWFRFELRFGVGAVMASIHDVLVTLGLFALAGFEFNLTTVAAFLTLVGYSMNDTVVIFDRIRENMRKNRRKPLIEVMNDSINQTLSRTLLTGGLTLLSVLALLALGGPVLRGFAFVMAVGILVGTYSSIYVASPFALLWEKYFGTERKAAQTAAQPGRPVEPTPNAAARR
ncbi:MAG TPA: protein translocase subunit SecF [Thermoanaerobaculia bacterium]|jgi:preprotein translocase subunit SecF|nr:protein translocase subunit SecF [Thermoanaerobaculia bacterium]